MRAQPNRIHSLFAAYAGRSVPRTTAALLVVVIAAAATPSVAVNGLRLIPVIILPALTALLLTVYQLLAQPVRFNAGAILLFMSLVFAAFASILGSLDAGNGVPFTKLLILIYQYSFVLIAWIAAPYISLTNLGVVTTTFASGYSLLLLLQSAGIIPGADPTNILGTSLRRASLFFSQPNGSAAYLAFALPLSFLYRPTNPITRFLILIARIAIILGLLATYSRSAIAATILVCFSINLCNSFRYGALARPAFSATITCAFLASLSSPIYELAELVTASDGALQGDYSAIERYGLGSAGIHMFYEYPLFGVGVGNYATMLGTFDSTLDASLNIPHNIVINVAAEQGIVGLIALIVFIWLLIARISNKNVPKPLNWAVWTLLINGWFGWPFIHGLGEPFMILTGLVLHHARCPAVESDDRSVDPIKGGTARATF